jgi:hypothetical protein
VRFNLFSIICQVTHTKEDVLLPLIRCPLSSPGFLPLARDAKFKTKDASFPHTYLQTVDKLWGLTLIAAAYSGPTQRLGRGTHGCPSTIHASDPTA